MKKWLNYLAPFSIFGLIAVFVWNVATHGQIDHPGKFTYENKCSGCHGEKGEGIETLIPPLYAADFMIANFDSLPCIIKHGINRPITVNGIKYDQPMYGVEISQVELTNLINYMARDFAKIDREVSADWVKKKIQDCQ
jgi:mono/diheme cytochrome c family protein